MRTFIGEHRLALMVACIVGLITVAPSFIAPLSLHGGYKGVLFAPLDDEDLYRGVVQDVLDGHPMGASPFVYEGKDTAHVLVPPFTPWTYAALSLVLTLSGAIIFAKFFFPALLFFLVYYLVRMLFKEESGWDAVLTAMGAGLAVVFGYEFVNYQHVIPVIKGIIPPVPPIWTRPVNPVVGVIEFFAFSILAYRVWIARAPWPTIIAAGIILGLSVSYYFSFGMCLALLGFLGLFALLRKEFKIVRDYLAIGLLSLVVDGYFLWNGFSLSGESSLATRKGLFYTHELVINKFLLLATLVVGACLLVVYVRRTHREHVRKWLFIAALIGASWLAFNEQIITGREIWYYHFVQFTIPASMLALLAAGYLSIRPLVPRLFRLGIYALCALSLAYGLFTLTSYRSSAEAFARQQSYAPVFAWLNANAPKDCSILVMHTQNDSDLRRLIPAYTACNTYMTPAAEFIEDTARIQNNYFLMLRLSGVRPTELRAYLLSHEEDICNNFFENWNQLHHQVPSCHFVEPFFETTVDHLVIAYPAFYSSDIKPELLRYRFDYLVTEEPASASLLALLAGLTERDKAGGFVIYSF